MEFMTYENYHNWGFVNNISLHLEEFEMKSLWNCKYFFIGIFRKEKKFVKGHEMEELFLIPFAASEKVSWGNSKFFFVLSNFDWENSVELLEKKE